MVEVESFLKGNDGKFVPIEDCKNPPSDSNYIEGFIRLVVDGREVMGADEWDLVDQLWAYIAELAYRLGETTTVRTTFPDQPLEFSMSRQGDRILVTCGDRKASADASELLGAFRVGGIQFFDHIDRLLPSKAFRYTESRRLLCAH